MGGSKMRPTISIVLAALIITAGQPTCADAQDVPVLSGVSTAKFEMEDLDAGARRCGLNTNALLNALKLPIRAYTKIHEITEGAGLPFFLLRVQTVAQKLRPDYPAASVAPESLKSLTGHGGEPWHGTQCNFSAV
jgi:hypothetical protein